MRSAASPTVAPTTRPTEPIGAAPAFAAAACAAVVAATVAPSGVRACCTSAPSGFDVRHRTNSPRPVARASSTAGASDPNPRYGETVSASPASGEPSARNASAYAPIVEPMSPRFASTRTSVPVSRPAATTSSSAATPAEPCRSKKAACGLTAATRPATASMTVSANRRTPRASSVRPHCASRLACGSMPTHSGPCASIAAASRAPNGSRAAAGAVTPAPASAGCGVRRPPRCAPAGSRPGTARPGPPRSPARRRRAAARS